MSITLQTPIWFQVEGRHPNEVTTLPGSNFIHLLRAIKEEEGLTCSASSLILRAKKEIDLDHVTTLTTTVFKKDCQRNFSKLIEIFGVDEDNPIKVTLPTTAPAFDPMQARQDDDSLYISTRDMLKRQPEYIPACDQLLDYLQQPPIKPIEIHPLDYERYFQPELAPEILNQLFVRSTKASHRVWTEFIANIASPPRKGTTEDSFHGLWDALIVKPFTFGCPDGVYNRNTSLHTSTRKLRPDLSYLVYDACLARGEEKAPDTDGDPAEELTEKLTWTYGSCPYIFGYHARADRVTYCYLYLEGERVLRKDLLTCDLNTVHGRLQAFIYGINIARLLPLLRQTLPQYFQREFTVLHRPRSGKVIELMQNVVVKRYRSSQPVSHLRAIYHDISEHNVPYIEQLTHVNEDETKTPFVILSPKGIMCKPQSKEQLIKALCCVLTALQALHEMGIMHRDIRWENVLKYIDRDKWFIIDFDDACYTTSPASGAHLAKDNHAPEIFGDHHNESVDIWSVGTLILTASVRLQEFDELKVYARKLAAKNQVDRPTAEEGLQWLWNRYRNILREEFLEKEL